MTLLIKTTGLEEYLDPSGEAYIKALIMGDPGSGKTPFGAQWPKPIFAACEPGLASIARNKVPYASIRTSQDMSDLMDQLEKETKFPVENRRWRTLVVDTIDSWQRSLIEQRKKSEGKEGLSGWQDWGWLDGQMTGFLERVTNLKMNVVVLLHVRDHEETSGEGDDKVTTIVRKAKLKGDIKDSIWQDFDLIAQIEKYYDMVDGERLTKRRIRWHSEPQFPYLRDRLNVMPRFTDVTFDPSDFQQIFDCIAGSLDDVPETEQVAEVESGAEAAVDPAPADATGGPVESPKLPPAKKAAAKKTAAKAAAPAPEPEPTPEPTPEPIAETPVAEAAPVEPEGQADPAEGPVVNGRGTADQPVVLPGDPELAANSRAAEKLDHVHDENGVCLRNVFGDPCHKMSTAVDEPVEEELPVEEPPAEPEPAPEPPKPAPAPKTGAKHCGEQPATMVGKHEPHPGCGRELSAENASKAQISMLKFKTYLCDDCHAAAVA